MPAYIPLVTILVLLIGWLYFCHVRPSVSSPLDLITRNDGKLSMTKIGQVIGMVVSTWVVIKMTATETLSIDIFLAWLTYIAATDGFSKWMHTRNLPAQQQDQNAHTTYGDVVQAQVNPVPTVEDARDYP